jgi:hypothetical protein
VKLNTMTSATDTDTASPIKELNRSIATDQAGQLGTWIEPLVDVVNKTDLSIEARLRTSLSGDVQSRHPTIYWPSDMPELQPRNFRYLQSFAKNNGLKLLEDRRNMDVQPILEKRDRKPAMIALGLSLLMKQMGIPGAARIPSTPHRLNSDSRHIGLGRLIKMAAFAASKSKRVVVLPNRILVNALKDTQPISGHACKLNDAASTTILSHFDSPYFRSIGYSTGTQYVTHICLAGGPRDVASLWTQLPTLTNTDFKLQLFPGERACDDFGLFYITFYLNMAENPVPWWLTADTHEDAGLTADTHKDAEPADSHKNKSNDSHPDSQRKAS